MGMWDKILDLFSFRNEAGRMSGRYRERSFYENTYSWLSEVPELYNYPDPYAKADNELMSVHDRLRLQLYKFNRALYYGDHYNAFRFAQYLYRSGMMDDDVRVSQLFGKGGLDVLFIAMNLFALTTDTFADLISGAFSPPMPGEWDEQVWKAIKRICSNSNLDDLLHRSIITGSYKGDIVFTSHWDPEKKCALIKGRRVDTWFPVIDPRDRTRFSEHSFVSQLTMDKKDYVGREIYGPDGWRLEAWEIVGNVFSKKAPASVLARFFGDSLREGTYPADGTMPLVYHVPNKIGDDNDPYGDSDYGRGVLTLADELNHRLTQLGHQLDKHGNLGMSGPDQGGEGVDNPHNDNEPNRGASGKYIIRDDMDVPEPKYIELPTAHLDTIKTEIDFLTEEIVRQMRMSPRLLGYKLDASQEAFDTLRLACVNTLLRNKARIMYLDDKLLAAVRAALQLEFENKVEGAVDPREFDLRIKWGDGFPMDEEKRARIWGIRTGNAETGTVLQAVQDMDGPEGAQATVDAIRGEKNQSMNDNVGFNRQGRPLNLRFGNEAAPAPKPP